jgi:KaiC/GvpD/RAD55 family RecA-like ATPase
VVDEIAAEFEITRLVNAQLEFHTLVRVVVEKALHSSLWPRLTSDHFASESAGALFKRLQNLHQAGRDWPSLATLALDPALPPAAQAQLETVLARVDSGKPLTRSRLTLENGQEVDIDKTSDLDGHVFDLLESYRITRTAAEHFVNTINEIADGDTFDPFRGPEIVERAASEVLAIRGRESISDVLLQFGHQTTDKDEAKRQQELDRLFDTNRPVFKTGFEEYDERAGGFQPGEIVLVGAPTGNGKTAFMLSLLTQMSRLGTSCAMLQLELPLLQINERLGSSLADVPSETLRAGRSDAKIEKRIRDAWADFHADLQAVNARASVYAPSTQTVQGCEQVFKQYPFKVWFVDYVSLIEKTGLDGWEKLSEIVKEFKALAKKYGITIVLAVQVNWNPDDGEFDIRYAKAMKEHADVILVWALTKEDKEAGSVYIRHLKARQYDCFDFQLRPNLKFCRFENMVAAAKPKLRRLGKRSSEKDSIDEAVEVFKKKDKPLEDTASTALVIPERPRLYLVETADDSLDD